MVVPGGADRPARINRYPCQDRQMRWLARGEQALPADPGWLSTGEARRAAGLRYTKRRTEYLLRRLAAKHAVAAAVRLPTDPAALARIEIRNAPSGKPYVVVDGAPAGVAVSITDRAGWAVCLVGSGNVGCDLELVEPRSPGFVRDFLTAAEQEYVAGAADRDVAANLLWSAKESALKVLGTGLRRDTRSVEVTVHNGRPGDWAPLSVRTGPGTVLPGWWRRDGHFLLTVAAEVPGPPPVPLEDPAVLAAAVPVHSWLTRPV
jgi:4'-phosphopantetheinyl transferase